MPATKAKKGAKASKKDAGELFLIDGNSLAYRAFFALPESIATHDGRPTNAIYGLASMFAKMLIDHSPAAVVVAWDAGWSGREKTYKPYKAQRKSRPDLLKEQWPHFIPLAEAFGFSNVRVEGFEADDVIASLTKRARERGTDVMVVSGDRDVYQLVEDGVRVMTTSRGVTDTKIYDTEGVIERYGVPPDLVTDLIGLKGDTSDNIPGVPGIGDKTAATLLQEFGSLEEVLANVDKISGKKRKENLTKHAEDARISKQLATAILDIDFELDLEEVMSRTMDRGRLREFAREFELRQIIQRLEEELGEDYVPEAEVDEELEVIAEEGQPSDLAKGEAAVAIAGGRWAAADKKKVVAGDVGELSDLASELRPHPLIGHDIKSLGGGARHGLLAAAGDDGLDLRHDTMVGGYLLDPARRTYDLADIAAQRGLAAASAGEDEEEGSEKKGAEDDGQLELGAEPEEEVADPAAEARLVFELAALQRKSMEENGLEKLMDEVEMPLVEVLAEVERTGVKLDAKRLAEIGDGFEKRIDKLESEIHKLAGDEFTIGSPQQLAEVLFVKLGLTKKRRGKTGFSTDARVLGQIREEHEIVPKIETWRELTKLKSTYLDALPELIDPDTGRIHTTFNQTATATGRLSSTNPNLQNIPIRSDEGRPIRSCFVAPRGQRLLSADYNQIELRILAHIAGEDALREIFAARRGHPHRHRRRGPGRRPREGHARRALQGEDGQLRNRLRPLRLRPLGPPQHRAGGGRRLHRPLLRALSHGQGLHHGDGREGPRGGLRHHPARPPPPDPRAAVGPPPDPQPGRAPRGQHADPGHLGRHHQDRDGERAPRSRRGGHGDPPGPPDPRRAPVRGPGRGNGGGGRARGARDVRRLRARPAARGRRRRRPRLALSQVTRRPRVAPLGFVFAGSGETGCMDKVLFTPFGIAAGLAAGFVGKVAFDQIWKLIDEEEPPEPDQNDIDVRKLVIGLALQGAIFRAVRGVAEHQARRGFQRWSGALARRAAPRAEVATRPRSSLRRVDKGLAVFLMAVVGGLIALQAPINAGLGKETGSFAAALVSFAVGTSLLAAIVVLSGKAGGLGEATASPGTT